jgi:hypothetical protein
VAQPRPTRRWRQRGRSSHIPTAADATDTLPMRRRRLPHQVTPALTGVARGQARRLWVLHIDHRVRPFERWFEQRDDLGCLFDIWPRGSVLRHNRNMVPHGGQTALIVSHIEHTGSRHLIIREVDKEGFGHAGGLDRRGPIRAIKRWPVPRPRRQWAINTPRGARAAASRCGRSRGLR